MIVVFPGQGSQTPGMGKDIYDNFASARDVFHEVDDAVSFSLSKLIFEGSEDDLKATEHTQPALLAVSMAFVSVLKTEFGFDVCERAKFFAGHSLGEYTALCAAGSISLCDAARILKLRGKAMAEAYPIGGAMAAILGMETDALTPIVAELSSPGAIVQIANDNSFGQIVISGHADAVQKATQVAVERGAKKTIMLHVSGPFHCELMRPAVGVLEDVLNGIDFKSPSKPIISNVSAKPEIENFRELLLRQIVGTVRWRESILYARDHGVSRALEVGPGRVLTGLVRRITPEVQLCNINSLESLKMIPSL